MTTATPTTVKVAAPIATASALAVGVGIGYIVKDILDWDVIPRNTNLDIDS